MSKDKRDEARAEELFDNGSNTKQTTETSAYEQWYAKVRDDLRTLMDNESRATLHFKHAIGRRIVQARHELQKIVPVKDENGWNKQLKILEERLETELEYKRQTLNYCYRFAVLYPSYDEFAELEFPVVRGGANRLENPPTKVLGKDLSWTELIRQELQETGDETAKKAVSTAKSKTSSRKSKKTTTNTTSPGTFYITLPVDVLQTFRNTAFQNNTTPEELIAGWIKGYVNTYHHS
jgi:hypothetical protein